MSEWNYRSDNEYVGEDNEEWKCLIQLVSYQSGLDGDEEARKRGTVDLGAVIV